MKAIIFSLIFSCISSHLTSAAESIKYVDGYIIRSNFNVLISVESHHSDSEIKHRLTISDKNITTIASNAFKNIPITTLILDLADTKLDLMWTSFDGLPVLETLWFSSGIVPLHHRLFEIVKNVNSLMLKIDGNLRSLQGAILDLNFLRSLTLIDSNLLSIDHQTFANYPPIISHLELSNNNIASIGPNTFSHLVSLKHLSLSSNKLEELQLDTFNGLHLLETLRISSNRLSTIQPYYFNKLGELRLLDLTKNKIDTLQKNSFSGLKISTLQLSQNKLRSLQRGMFSGLARLDVLNLDYNHISSMEIGVFSGLKLLLLNLRNNELKEIALGSFFGLSVTTVDLFGNKIFSIKNCSTKEAMINTIRLNHGVYRSLDNFSVARNATPFDYLNKK